MKTTTIYCYNNKLHKHVTAAVQEICLHVMVQFDILRVTVMSIRAIGSQQCVTQRLSVGMSDLLKIQTHTHT